jgi:8-hydroxy-5-deazaflavin:NADPH oxidoreductase
MFITSNDADASATVAAIATRLAFAPVELARLDKGRHTTRVLGGQPEGLLFQNLVKLAD